MPKIMENQLEERVEDESIGECEVHLDRRSR